MEKDMITTTERHAKCFYYLLKVDKMEVFSVVSAGPTEKNLKLEASPDSFRWKGYCLSVDKTIYAQMVEWSELNGISLFMTFAKRFPSGFHINKVWEINSSTPYQEKENTVLLRARHLVKK